ncbi:MAG: hypothetical protein Q8N83_17330 [Ignavibacteria bacterium]|nr:hypothetical protein [Ignavibacteria bacterium]
MKLKFIDGSKYNLNVKCSIHLTGKLGFSQSAIDSLQLDNNKYVAFATNEEDKKDLTLYMVVYNEKKEGAFKIVKAGNYYYLNTKKMFDELGIDYKKKTIIYDISNCDYEGEKIYKLIRREYDRKQKE